MSPRLSVWLSIGAYFVAVPVLHGAGNGYFTIVSLVPVATTGLLYGSARGILAATVFTPLNFGLVWLLEGSLDSMLAPGGLLGSASLFGLGWLVGYLGELASARLIQVAEEKDRLIETISHELRTPLTTVSGLARELADRVDRFTAIEVAEFCGLIAQQSAELESLIEDLLVAARADIERITVRAIPVDLGAVTHQVVSGDEPNGECQIRLQAPAGDAVVAIADELRVRQILRNLLQNARRYGGCDIEVEVSRSGSRCRLRVSDDGPGISEEAVDSIFAPHTRAHVEDGNTESLGLGLYVSQILARLMNGEIEYRRLNGRTCFDLVVPASVDDIQADRPIRIGAGTA